MRAMPSGNLTGKAETSSRQRNGKLRQASQRLIRKVDGPDERKTGLGPAIGALTLGPLRVRDGGLDLGRAA